MYVAISGEGKARVIQFVEQHRIPKTNKKKTIVIKTLGNYEKMLEDDPNIIEKLRAEARRLTKEKKEANKPITVELSNKLVGEDYTGEDLYHIGHSVILGLWEDLRLDAFFDKHCHRRNKESLILAIKGLVIHRITNPESILKSWLNLKRYAGFRGPCLDTFYAALDVMNECKDFLIDHLNKQFARKTKRTFGVAHYDVTTYAFESTRCGELRLFGYSKDHKHNEVQVVMGLLIDEQGIPISYSLFPGNTMDQATLQEAVQDLKKRYDMDKIVIVADKGLNGKDNLQYLSEEGHDFVIAYTLRKAPDDIKALALNEKGWTNEEIDKETGEILYREKCLQHTLEVKVELTEEEKKQEPKRRGRPRKYKYLHLKVNIHLTWSAKRAQKDFIDRERTLAKVKEDLTSPGKIKSQLKRGRSQYIDCSIDLENAKLDQERIDEQSQYDGYYAIVTNQFDYTTKDVVELYSGLWQIEESFRILKTDLLARPVFVWLDPHIEGHFAYCYLSLCILRYSQFLLREKADMKVSAGQIMEALYDPLVDVIGDYPLITMQLKRFNPIYYTLSKELGMGDFRENMTLAQFRSATKLDLSMNEQISGQI